MANTATVQTYCDTFGRGTAVTEDGKVYTLRCCDFFRKGPGDGPCVWETRPGTVVRFIGKGQWRIVAH